ncbi:MAG: polysaccharide deacetylase family protein, partial [Flavobacterium sp.]
MKKLVITFAVILFALLTNSCQKKESESKSYQAGVVISFDDAYVDEWFEADSVLKKYNWKATFCVCRIDSIEKPQLKKLHQLQDGGNEIAGHGYHHYNAVKFVQSNGIQEYVKQEIDPMMISMKRNGFKVTSFAYPYGERSSELDTIMASKFKFIRGRAFCEDQPEREGCYFRDSKFAYAFDIDNSHVHFSIPYLLELLDDTRRNNKILFLCSHRPVKNITANYQTKIETLEFICKYMKLNNMKYY